MLFSVLFALVLSFSFIQVKETNDVVLAGAYVDLHGATEASPESLTQVCQVKKYSFQTTGLLFLLSNSWEP